MDQVVSEENKREPGWSTTAIHGDSDRNQTRAVVAPIWQSATYRRETAEELVDAANTRAPEDFYGRWANPNNKQLEQLVARLEGASGAIAFASGMAAASAAIAPHLSPGDHVVASKTLYGDTRNLLERVLRRFGVGVTFAAGISAQDYEDAMLPETRLVVLETPANPTLDCVDIALVSAIARKNNARVVVDNTFASPFNTRPIALGAHAVFHSATKYLAGHSDVVAGVVAGDDVAVARAWDHLRTEGGVLSPFDAWLVVRGIRTFPLRMARHNENALAIARFLEAHPRVHRVFYPMLESHPSHALAKSQMRGGGGVVSVELEGGSDMARAFVERLKLFALAPSLGGVESLVMYPSSLSRMSDEQRLASGISPSLVRLAIGVEDVEDLIDDLTQALR